MSLFGESCTAADNFVETNLQARNVVPRHLLIELIRLVDESSET